MLAPRILSIGRAHGFVPPLPKALTESARLYVVIEEGWFLDRRWRTGEILVCGDEQEGFSGPVVLEARGLGRPRPGLLERGRLLGDAGEPCSSARWAVAGALHAVLRPARVGEQVPAREQVPDGWVLEALSARPLTRVPHQLPLFSQAA